MRFVFQPSSRWTFLSPQPTGFSFTLLPNDGRQWTTYVRPWGPNMRNNEPPVRLNRSVPFHVRLSWITKQLVQADSGVQFPRRKNHHLLTKAEHFQIKIFPWSNEFSTFEDNRRISNGHVSGPIDGRRPFHLLLWFLHHFAEKNNTSY